MDRLRVSAIVAGIVVAGLGFIAIISVIGESRQNDTRAFGMMLLSLGMLIVAIPHYVAGRRLLFDAELRAKESAKIFRLFPCATCGRNAASFWCTTHNIKLCTDCIPKHHDTDRCLYKPFLVKKAR